MLAAEGASQSIQSAQAVVVVLAVVCALFWRHVLRFVLAVVAIAVVVLVTSGVVVIIQAMHHA